MKKFLKYLLILFTLFLLISLMGYYAFSHYSLIPKEVIVLWKNNPLSFTELKALLQLSQRGYLLDHDPKNRIYDQHRQYIGSKRDHAQYRRIDQISPWVLLAVVANEDERFWKHAGFDIRAIARAIYQNLKGIQEGGSTITQQLAKAWLSNERTITRKIKELNLAIQIEKHLSKEEILERYLNEIYFGQQAYGIEQASRAYFRKSAIDLTLAESCLLASVIPLPSKLNPAVSFKKSIDAALRILFHLEQLKWVTHDQRMMARKDLLNLKKADIEKKSSEWEKWAPFYAEHSEKVAKGLLSWLKKKAPQPFAQLNRFDIQTFMDLFEQAQAQEKLWLGANRLGRKQGFYGITAHEKPKILKKLKKLCPQSKQALAQLYQVASIDIPAQKLWLSDPCDALNPTNPTNPTNLQLVEVSKPSWFKAFELEKTNNPTQAEPLMPWESAIQVGDMLWLRQGELIQNPYPQAEKRLEGALMSMDLSGKVRAMVGSTDYQSSQFNRATQSCRPIGSLIKPFIYWYAFLYGDVYLDTLLSDAPVSMYDASSEQLWKPRDHQRTTGQGVTIKEAIAESLNLPMIHLTQKLGLAAVRTWLQDFGFQKLSTQFNFVLGSSCESLSQLIQLFSSIPNALNSFNDHQSLEEVTASAFTSIKDFQVKPKFIKKISTPFLQQKELIWFDQRGLQDAENADDLAELMLVELSQTQQTQQTQQSNPPSRQEKIKQATLSLDTALKAVLTEGTGKAFASQAKKWKLAGKTGSTDLYDAWFIGYQSNRITGAWIGNDLQKKAIGQGEGGASMALPIVMDWLNAIEFQAFSLTENQKKLEDEHEKLNFSQSPSKSTINQEKKLTQPKPKKLKSKASSKQKSDEELEGEF